MNATMQRNLGLLALMAATLTACSAKTDSSSAGPGSAPDATGTASAAVSKPVDPIVLRLGTGDAKDAPSADQIRWFAKRVTKLSDGQITIKPVWLAAGDVQRFETATAKQAIDGDLDLALVASRAWDTVGVRTLTPLNAPFVVTSDELVAKVVTGPIQDELLSGLPEAGVVGLGLWPEGLRHPFGFGDPLDGPGDYKDALIRAPYSKTTQGMFQHLGAETTDGASDTSTQRGAESGYRLAPTGIATGNVVFYPKINALVSNADAEAALTNTQRAVLRQAAGDTRDWVVNTWPTDNEAARTFCSEGGKIQSATTAQVQSMKRATKPVVDAMKKDDVLGPILEKVAEAAVGVEAGKPRSGCGDRTHTVDQARLDGTYRFTVTPAAGRKAGVTDPEIITEGAGTYTARLEDGSWSLDQVFITGSQKGTTTSSIGDYAVDGNRLTWFWSHEPGQQVTATFTVMPDGSIEFSDVVSGEEPQWARMAHAHFSHWKHISS